MRCKRIHGFTLVEILIVVVILGILASIVVPQFASATGEAQRVATFDQLKKVRAALSVYYLQHASRFPNVTEGDGTWGELIELGYMREPPVNRHIGTGNSRLISMSGVPDEAWQVDYGWIYDADSGNAWAGSFDADDEPILMP